MDDGVVPKINPALPPLQQGAFLLLVDTESSHCRRLTEVGT